MLDHAKAFISNPVVGFAFAAIVLIVERKMTTTWANGLLVLAWALLVVSIFRTAPFADLVVLPRALWTASISGPLALVIYYLLWTIPVEQKLTAIANSEYRDLVAETIRAFSPKADIQVGGTTSGPDGQIKIDIAIRAAVSGRISRTLIDVFDSPLGGPVGIEAIDAIDSRRRDLDADYALVFSNSGFDASALRKANRSRIGLLSILKQGDSRIRALIEQEVFLRRISLSPITVNVQTITAEDTALVGEFSAERSQEISYENRPLATWLILRAILVSIDNPTYSGPLHANFSFLEAVEFELDGQPLRLAGVGISFSPRTEWLSQTVQLDASSGMYDYIRGRVRMAPGQNTYTVSGIDFNTATPIEPPADPPGLPNGIGLARNEVDMAFFLVDGVAYDFMAGPAPNLDPLVVPEDLQTKMNSAASP